MGVFHSDQLKTEESGIEMAHNTDHVSTMIPTTMSLLTNMTNMTEPDRILAILTQVSSINSTLLLVLIMLMMGATIDLSEVRESFRRPVGFAIGMTSQFILMPLISFCLALALQLQTAGALSLLILGCCPGGTLSNIFTYWCNGDVCLSVSMTTVSSAAAIGMMPLNLFVYSRVWTDNSAVIPYVNIVITLVSILVPAVFAIGLRHFREKWADIMRKICSVVISILIAFGFLLIVFINPTFYLAGWGLWIAGVILPIVGYTIGYGFALLLRQSHKKCRAIAFETGSQNVALALTLTNMSFAGTELFLDMLFLPTLYAIFIFVDSFVVVAVYKLYVRYHGDDEDSYNGKDTATDVKEDFDDKAWAINAAEKNGENINDGVRGVYTQNIELEGVENVKVMPSPQNDMNVTKEGSKCT